VGILEQIQEGNAEHARAFDPSTLADTPRKKPAIVICMDSRLSVEAITGLKPGDAHIIRNAGGLVTDDVIRSLLIATEALHTEEVFVINHTGCALTKISPEQVRDDVRARTGKHPETPAGQPFATWLGAFKDLEENVRAQVQRLRDSLLIRANTRVYGFIYHMEDGRLERVV